ncbi:UDP-glucuronic acid decarboxylase 1 [Datura stramonium]|uniref:UDP-glucuronic acid decarboxylase 1 n=1 Tax=Datura stramonium TaxID=4076 RepID=A0ABS8T0H1_DATST|nr:UDP-glucuronic acid decarboxylase 1 [Datura stramonium]
MGTLNMLGLAKRIGARFLLTSTSEVYGDPLEHPRKRNILGKCESNSFLKHLGVRSCYDEGKRTAETLSKKSPSWVQAIRKQPLTVYGDGKQTRSFALRSDLVVKEVIDSSATIEFRANTADDPHKRKPDISRAKKLLNWEPKYPARGTRLLWSMIFAILALIGEIDQMKFRSTSNMKKAPKKQLRVFNQVTLLLTFIYCSPMIYQLRRFVEKSPCGRYIRYSYVGWRGLQRSVHWHDRADEIVIAWNQSFFEEEDEALKTLRNFQNPNHDQGVIPPKLEKVSVRYDNGTDVDLASIKNWGRQILEGLSFLHSQSPKIIHRDIKCDNVFVDSGGKQCYSWRFWSATTDSTMIWWINIHSDMYLLEMVTGEYPYMECSNGIQIFGSVHRCKACAFQRHEMPETVELSPKNIKDCYYGDSDLKFLAVGMREGGSLFCFLCPWRLTSHCNVPKNGNQLRHDECWRIRKRKCRRALLAKVIRQKELVEWVELSNTVNNQMVNATLMNIADNPMNVQLPGIYNKQENARVPIIVTREDRIGVCKGIFRTDSIRDEHACTLSTLPGQSTGQEYSEDEVRKWIESTGIGQLGKTIEGPPTFEQPKMTIEKLL